MRKQNSRKRGHTTLQEEYSKIKLKFTRMEVKRKFHVPHRIRQVKKVNSRSSMKGQIEITIKAKEEH
jgi:hypothetical protein